MNGKRTLLDFSEYIKNSINAVVGKDFYDLLFEWTKSGTTYYGWNRIKYFLFEYELHLQAQTKTTRSKLDWASFAKEKYTSDFETVEHIYPQRARSEYWKSRFDAYTPKEKALLRNSLGNLLALSRPKNASLGNKPFPDKLGDEINKVGYTYGCYSEIEVSKVADWNASAITARGISMMNFLEHRWKLQIGDNSQKLRALGLDFVISKSIRLSK